MLFYFGYKIEIIWDNAFELGRWMCITSIRQYASSRAGKGSECRQLLKGVKPFQQFD